MMDWGLEIGDWRLGDWRMNSEELKRRTKKFALDVVKLVENFPKTKAGDIIGRQLLKSATSVGANYRSACRARSRVMALFNVKKLAKLLII